MINTFWSFWNKRKAVLSIECFPSEAKALGINRKKLVLNTIKLSAELRENFYFRISSSNMFDWEKIMSSYYSLWASVKEEMEITTRKPVGVVCVKPDFNLLLKDAFLQKN